MKFCKARTFIEKTKEASPADITWEGFLLSGKAAG